MESYCQTDVGLKRNNNQDFVYASDQMVGALSCLWIVADGMGGHAAGDIASRLCVETMIDTISNSKQEGPVRILAEAIRSANEVVCEKARSTPDLEGMGTTVVAATVDEGCLYIANVGDSRLYLIDDERIEQITHDHSLVEEMVRAGRIRADQARNHPKKNIITRAIGEEGVPEIDFWRHPAVVFGRPQQYGRRRADLPDRAPRGGPAQRGTAPDRGGEQGRRDG